MYFYPSEYLTYGVQRRALVNTDANGAKTYNLFDHLGSVRDMINGAGAQICDYEPFGTVLVGGTHRKGFVDRERDRETGQLNTGVRQLDEPGYMSVDPKWEEYRAWSPYNYAANNPLRIVDLYGLDWLLYDGKHLYWYGGKYGDKSELKQAYKASSGKDGQQNANQQRSKGGPVPEGKYLINLIPDPRSPSQRVGPLPLQAKPGSGIQMIEWKKKDGTPGWSWEWGTMRARLDPSAETDTYGRSDFYIHNSRKGHTLGCIEASYVVDDLVRWRKENPEVKVFEVKVDYPRSNTSTNGHTNWKEE